MTSGSLAKNLLDHVYNTLSYSESSNWFDLSQATVSEDFNRVAWIDQGRKIGAEAIFFVDTNPIALFFAIDDDNPEEIIRNLHIEVWNASRIPLFFVALPTELRVYSSYQKPSHDLDDWESKVRWLKRINILTSIAEQLNEFSRPEIEIGTVFKERPKDFLAENSVDQSLLSNLRLLRQRLGGQSSGKQDSVHALIGRSIFVRYLEDRNILLPTYFQRIYFGPLKGFNCYADVLSSKKDTYAFFDLLKRDFNGDIFPLEDNEFDIISDKDLVELKDFLLGKSMSNQTSLLFWAYRFDIIPIELISSIYEEFYSIKTQDLDKGTHYTPITLVEFLVNQTLNKKRLKEDAKILDPACGSGVFLVECFKKIVAHKKRELFPGKLGRKDLELILTRQIFGVDLNKAAIQIAAFSLYLAFLEYLDPRDIEMNKSLPPLIFSGREDGGHNLFYGDSFFLTNKEREKLKESIKNKIVKQPRFASLALKLPVLSLPHNEFDIIIGNPPWGSLDNQSNNPALIYSNTYDLDVGDKELSQLFIWRALGLVAHDGEIAFLVSTGIFFKHSAKSIKFRRAWLTQSTMRAVYNFSHTRHVFFKRATSPFAAVFFSRRDEKNSSEMNNSVLYATVKKRILIEKLQAVIIDSTDINKVKQNDFVNKDWLWKAYMWGSIADIELIEEIKSCYPPLGNYSEVHGRGYEIRKKETNYNTSDLGVNQEINPSHLAIGLDIEANLIRIIPSSIGRLGKKELYFGPRLIIKRGISEGNKTYGQILAKLVYKPMAFKNSVIAIRLDNLSAKKQKLLLAITLSSLAKYYHFLTCSTWGLWHYEIHKEEHLSLPVNFIADSTLEDKIISTLDDYLALDAVNDLFYFEENKEKLENALNELVFDLYDLSDSQRDLVRDLCNVKLKFFYEGSDSEVYRAVSENQLMQYNEVFVKLWNRRLIHHKKSLESEIYQSKSKSVAAMTFDLIDSENLTEQRNERIINQDDDWDSVLSRIGEISVQKYTSNIYIDRVLMEISSSSIFIAKRGEALLWTKSQARLDAGELLTHLFKIEWNKEQQGNII